MEPGVSAGPDASSTDTEPTSPPSPAEPPHRKRQRIRARWRSAARMAREQLFEVDPLEELRLDARPLEQVLRRRWTGGQWIEDIAQLKVASSAFAAGSQRTCFLAKKMSSRVTVRHYNEDSKHSQWAYQRNYVLKAYKASMLRGQAEEVMIAADVQMQAESKALAAKYNACLLNIFQAGKFDRRAPQPMKLKCVDMLEAALIVFKDRPGKPTFFMEAHIPGEFLKHNDNCGVVLRREAGLRQTPQAFSHFTFCQTRGQLLVVDVQGVEDLFTDPQVHTADGVGFGVGNGGVCGMALFFATHRCNRICKCMRLERFALRGHVAEIADPMPRRTRPTSALSPISEGHLNDDYSNAASTQNQKHNVLQLLDNALDQDLDDVQANQDGSLSPWSISDAVFAAVPDEFPPASEPLPCAERVTRMNAAAYYLYAPVYAALSAEFLESDDLPPSPASALYYLVAAALGGNAESAAALDALRAKRHEDAPAELQARSGSARATLAAYVKVVAAAALLAFAVKNVASIVRRR